MEGGDAVVGLAHLWLHFLPASYVRVMACVNMRWADAAGGLAAWREDLVRRLTAFELDGAREWGPDGPVAGPPMSALEVERWRRYDAEEAHVEEMQMERNAAVATAMHMEWSAARGGAGASLTDSVILAMGAEAAGEGGGGLLEPAGW